MSDDEKKTPEAEELPSEVETSEASPVEVPEEPLALEAVNELGLITDPDLFDIAWSDEQKAVMLVFPGEKKTLFLGFKGPAGEKFLTSMVVLLNLLFSTGSVERESDQFFEVPEKKKPTLH